VGKSVRLRRPAESSPSTQGKRHFKVSFPTSQYPSAPDAQRQADILSGRALRRRQCCPAVRPDANSRRSSSDRENLRRQYCGIRNFPGREIRHRWPHSWRSEKRSTNPRWRRHRQSTARRWERQPPQERVKPFVPSRSRALDETALAPPGSARPADRLVDSTICWAFPAGRVSTGRHSSSSNLAVNTSTAHTRHRHGAPDCRWVIQRRNVRVTDSGRREPHPSRRRSWPLRAT
jgi:hypothetical protein